MKDKHITISGDFGPDRRFDQLKKWVQNGGGKLSTTLSNDTTHLVVHKDHWRRQTQIGKLVPPLFTSRPDCEPWKY